MKCVLCFALVLLAGCSTNQPSSDNQAATRETTSSDQASTKSADSHGSDVASDVASEFVIDVRSKGEWDSGHVDKAFHIPHTEITKRISEVTDNKDAKIVVYCAVGGRAGKAKEALEEMGYTHVINAGGFDDIKTQYE